MRWTLQGSDAIVIDAPAETIWALLEDGPRLPEWMPIVKATTGAVEVLDAERTCEVEFEGKRGTVRERCVEYEVRRRIAWQLVDDTLGFGRLFDNLGFSFTLEPRSDGTTLVRNDSYYQPRNLLATLLSVVMMRRKFRGIRLLALDNLRQLCDASHVEQPYEVTLGTPA
jgi:uncharacterized membrane protein